MDKTVIRFRKGVKPSNPILIAGLPGIGNVGKVVVEHLKRELKAERIGTVYSPHFPHQVIMLKSGGIRLVSNRIYMVKAKRKGASDILLLTGDQQAVTPEGQYDVNGKIVKFFAERYGVKYIYTVGGYNTGEPIGNPPRVFANATSKKVVSSFKGSEVIFGKSKGIIWGAAGLIVAFAKMRGLDAVCLMGETNLLDVDANAAKSVILALSKRLSLEIKTDNLDKMIKNTAELLKELERQAAAANPEMLPPPPEGQHRPSYIR